MRKSIYVANDGTKFDTAADCKNHESAACWKRLAHLTEPDIARAMTREDIPLANAIERVGTLITASRKANGELRRKVPKQAPQTISTLQHGVKVVEAEMNRRYEAQKAAK